MSAVHFADWFAEQRHIYIGNAGSVKDLRANMRGWNAPVVLTVYLALLILTAMAFYAGIASMAGSTVTAVQSQLGVFFNVIVGMTEVLVVLIAPALLTSSVVGEYQRRTIDLVFSAPVSSKYYLIGKILSTFRYLAMLVALTLPISAIAVVMGGTTWAEVMVVMGLVLLRGLLCAAISLPIAIVSSKTVSAVTWSYIACGMAYVVVSIASLFTTASTGGTMVSPIIGLAPFFASLAAGSLISIGTFSVPSWIPGVLLGLLIIRTLIVGAGSALSGAASAETKSLRIHSLVLTALISLSLGLAAAPASIPFVSGGASSATYQLFAASMSLFIAIPFLSTWSPSGSAKGRHDGWFAPKRMLLGTPSGGLPFLLSLLATMTIAIGLPIWIPNPGQFLVDLPFVSAVWSLWLLAWSLGWIASGLGGRQGLTGARRLLWVLVVGIAFLPSSVLNVLGFWFRTPELALRFNLVYFLGVSEQETIVKACIMLLLAAILLIVAERMARSGRGHAYA